MITRGEGRALEAMISIMPRLRVAESVWASRCAKLVPAYRKGDLASVQRPERVRLDPRPRPHRRDRANTEAIPTAREQPGNHGQALSASVGKHQLAQPLNGIGVSPIVPDAVGQDGGVAGPNAPIACRR